MDRSTGGAKPKTSTGSNVSSSRGLSRNNNSSSLSSAAGLQTRHRSPRRESTGTSHFRGGATGHLNTAGNIGRMGSRSENNVFQRTSIPIARARKAPASVQSQSSSSSEPSSTQASVAAEARSQPPDLNHYRRPLLQQQNRNRRVGLSALASVSPPVSDVPHGPVFLGIANSVEDSESKSPVTSPSQPVSSAPQQQQQEADTALDQLAALQMNTSRPMSSSPDAVLARELLQSEMDQMMERDEEMARQLHQELNTFPPQDIAVRTRPPPPPFFEPGRMQGRAGNNPAAPGEGEPGGVESRPLRVLRLFRGPDGVIRVGLEVPGAEVTGLRLMMRPILGRGGGARAQRSQGESGNGGGGGGEGEAESGGGTASTSNISPQAEPGSVENDLDLPPGEFDPDERLLEDGADDPDDFLSVMHDPSLMLLMLLLRAPDTLHQSDGGMDLDDYDGLWDLAERLGEVRRRGMTEAQVNCLQTHKFEDGNSISQCQICLVDFENGDCLRTIPCRHDFHKDCIDQWLQRNATCPICRQEVKPGSV